MDFLNFDMCVDYIKRKLPTKVRKGKRDKKQDALEIIHIDISRPILASTMGGYKYFITIINDRSCNDPTIKR